MSRQNVTDLMVCKAYAEIRAIKTLLFPYDLLALWTGEPEKVCFRAMERAFNHGLIEYGVSLRSGWLTEKGLQLLKDNP